MTQRQPQVWAGTDVGKGHHWITVVDSDGDPLWNRKLVNFESNILAAFGEAMGMSDHVTWALDLIDGPASLLLEVLGSHGQNPRYVTGSKFAPSRRASAAKARAA
ncbi:transposase [Streptomyces sp. ISID311]|uniref:IS110 family transposase n=1 Tax=Streptomyces sp. ISID311 TaxID=2601673 RepID=UPI0011BD32E6|nr:transposase [Streptomyces sp. ISID311]TXC99765.1 IS110 family transposase [Streptomyces sp. ISID311]